MFTFFVGAGKVVYPIVNLTITADVDNYNIFTEAGSPTAPTEVILTIDAGVVVSSTVTANHALQTGIGWNALSTIKIVNNGDIYGDGGDGGAGANAAGSTCSNPAVGLPGGPAMDLDFDITLDNTNGNIYGGGGGGGGGGSGSNSEEDDRDVSGGGGGGGGRCKTSAGGVGGTATGAIPLGTNEPGTAGGSGSPTGAGAGGAGGNSSTADGGAGGAGGDWAASGSAGANPSGSTNQCFTLGVAGGAGGKAIDLNGYAITWEGGNNAAQVKGDVT